MNNSDPEELVLKHHEYHIFYSNESLVKLSKNPSEIRYLSSGNWYLDQIPPEIGSFYNLEELFTKTTHLPKEIGNLKKLKRLIIELHRVSCLIG